MKLMFGKCRKQVTKDFKKNIVNIVGATIYVFGMCIISATLAVLAAELVKPGKLDINNIEATPLLTVLSMLVVAIIWVPFIIGYFRYCICVSRKDVKIKNIMNPFVNRYFKRMITMVGWLIIVSIITYMTNALVTALFILIYGLVPFIIADDKDFSILKVYTQSRNTVTKYLESYALLIVLALICGVISILTLGLGLILTIPYFLIVYGSLYRVTMLDEEVNYTKVVYNIKDVEEKTKTKAKPKKKIKNKSK